jgi:RecJ-like exonuclease
MIPAIDDTDIRDPYPQSFDFPADWPFEFLLPAEVVCRDCSGTGEQADGDGCSTCRGDGWLFDDSEHCCEDGFLPLPDGSYVACFLCAEPEVLI